MAGATLQDQFLPLSQLRPLLARAEGDALGCAFAFAKDDKTEMLVMIDKRLNGKKVAAALRKGEARNDIDQKSLRFGTVRIDQVNDPGTVKFTVHKSAMGGTIPLLVKLVKKAGYSGAVIDTNEALDAEEDDGQGMAAATETGAPTPPPPPPPPLPPRDEPRAAAEANVPPPPPRTDLDKAALTALIRRIQGVTDPALRDKLTAVAKAAGAKLAQGAPIGAELQALEAALSKAAAAPAAGGTTDGAKSADEPKVALAKSSMVWRSCRVQLRGKLDTLKTAILAAYADAPEVQAAVREKLGALDRVFETFDDRLEDALDNATNAGTAEARREFVAQSRSVIADYTARIANDPLISDLDSNPFGVDMKFRETLNKVLPALNAASATIH